VCAAGGYLRLAAAAAADGDRRVYLAPAALQAIAALPRVPGNPNLFPGRGAGGRLSDLQAVWAQLRAAAGLHEVRLLDLRHSFASLGEATGDSLAAVGRLLGARDPQTLQRYPHAEEVRLKAAAERISGGIAQMLGEASAADPPEFGPGPGVSEGAVAGFLEDMARTRWLSPAEAALRSGLTVATLAAYRRQGTGPVCRKVGWRVLYPEPELVAWVAARAGAPRVGRPPNSSRR
jgi:hypothetical protein